MTGVSQQHLGNMNRQHVAAGFKLRGSQYVRERVSFQTVVRGGRVKRYAVGTD